LHQRRAILSGLFLSNFQWTISFKKNRLDTKDCGRHYSAP
jgi:hypothetical protein